MALVKPHSDRQIELLYKKVIAQQTPPKEDVWFLLSKIPVLLSRIHSLKTEMNQMRLRISDLEKSIRILPQIHDHNPYMQ